MYKHVCSLHDSFPGIYSTYNDVMLSAINKYIYTQFWILCMIFFSNIMSNLN